MMATLVRTARFGAVESLDVPDEALIDFPDGLPGFEGHTAFALIEDPQYAPFRWLQSRHDPHVKFVVLDVFAVRPDYALDLADVEAAALGLADPADAHLLCILTIPDDPGAMTANLKAPLVVNRAARRGKQVILTDDSYPLRYPVLTGGAARGAGADRCSS